MRRIALIVALLAAGAASVAASAGADDAHEYKIEMYNAFGIVEGSDVRVSGVNAGQVTDLEVNEAKRALVTVELSGPLAVLGDETTCSSEPQSLIAEYFIDCQPKGPALPDGGTIPASKVSQTVQQDLVQNTLREPFKDRLQLLINEFGTALAGNPENLNEAIRLGAPSLTQLRKVTRILGEQNAIIRDLNVNNDTIVAKLTERREDVVRFIQEARDTARASAERRDDLSRNFEILDDFLFELRPTLAELEHLAVEQTPLLTDLRAAAPGLNQLALNLPPFNDAARGSLDTLGQASVVGRRALNRGKDEIKQLAQTAQNAPQVGEILADLLRDIDDPSRAVEIDDRAVADTGRTNPNPGQSDTKGYTGLEGLLNYVYYQTGALNQYDDVSHLLHFTLYEVFTGPCGEFSTGRDPDTGEPGVPAEDQIPGPPLETTTNLLEADECVAWLGQNAPGINEMLDGSLPKYSPEVCRTQSDGNPDTAGTEPAAAAALLCSDTVPGRASARAGGGGGDGGGDASAQVTPRAGAQPDAAEPGGEGPALPELPKGPLPENLLEDLLELPKSALRDLPNRVRDQLRGVLRGNRRGGGGGGGGGGGLLGLGGGGGGGTAGGGGGLGGVGQAADDLLDFLFQN